MLILPQFASYEASCDPNSKVRIYADAIDETFHITISDEDGIIRYQKTEQNPLICHKQCMVRAFDYWRREQTEPMERWVEVQVRTYQVECGWIEV